MQAQDEMQCTGDIPSMATLCQMPMNTILQQSCVNCVGLSYLELLSTVLFAYVAPLMQLLQICDDCSVVLFGRVELPA